MTDPDPDPDELDVPAFVLAAQELGSVEDLRRLGRLTWCTDSESDRAHLRLLIVRALEDMAPGPPAELERIGKLTIASMRGAALRSDRAPRPPTNPPPGLPPGRG